MPRYALSLTYTREERQGLKITALKKLKGRFDSQDNVRPLETLFTIRGFPLALPASSSNRLSHLRPPSC